MTIASVSALQLPLAAQPAEPSRAASDRQADGAFAAELGGVEARRAGAADMPPAIHGKGGQSGKAGPLQQFEGFVLRTFVEAMLPQENTSFFGSGTAGGIWRSMLAEKLGDEIAAAGGIGIAEMLARDPTLAPEAQDTLRDTQARQDAAGAAKLTSI
ncbi:rod-binding protein [Aureimonas populi]|uniref:Rod-binding protein n=1 Tax=Aureimonas populi TaxID=1701758 RepID=A0ABW5CGE7_9HYPH|nr:rod-binding protein [Aureimonas populi]